MKWISRTTGMLAATAAAVVGTGYWLFSRKVEEEAHLLFPGTNFNETPRAGDQIIQAEMLAELPSPVRRYLTYAGVVGKPPVHTARLKQTGRFRTGPQEPWMALSAKQYYNADAPAFLWDATFYQSGLPILRAYDSYANGRGYMVGRLAALIKVLEGQGADIDQGAMLRYLNEMTLWFPSALLKDNVTLRAIDEERAAIDFSDCGKTVTAVITVDAQGRLKNFVAERYRDMDQTYGLWSTPIKEYGEIAGLRLPVRGIAVWKMTDGDFEYTDLTITDLEYNVPRTY